MKTAGSLQVAMTFSHHQVNHTQRRNCVLWVLVSFTSPVLSSFGVFFAQQTCLSYLALLIDTDTNLETTH